MNDVKEFDLFNFINKLEEGTITKILEDTLNFSKLQDLNHTIVINKTKVNNYFYCNIIVDDSISTRVIYIGYYENDNKLEDFNIYSIDRKQDYQKFLYSLLEKVKES